METLQQFVQTSFDPVHYIIIPDNIVIECYIFGLHICLLESRITQLFYISILFYATWLTFEHLPPLERGSIKGELPNLAK